MRAIQGAELSFPQNMHPGNSMYWFSQVENLPGTNYVGVICMAGEVSLLCVHLSFSKACQSIPDIDFFPVDAWQSQAFTVEVCT